MPGEHGPGAAHQQVTGSTSRLAIFPGAAGSPGPRPIRCPAGCRPGAGRCASPPQRFGRSAQRYARSACPFDKQLDGVIPFHRPARGCTPRSREGAPAVGRRRRPRRGPPASRDWWRGSAIADRRVGALQPAGPRLYEMLTVIQDEQSLPGTRKSDNTKKAGGLHFPPGQRLRQRHSAAVAGRRARPAQPPCAVARIPPPAPRRRAGHPGLAAPACTGQRHQPGLPSPQQIAHVDQFLFATDKEVSWIGRWLPGACESGQCRKRGDGRCRGRGDAAGARWARRLPGSGRREVFRPISAGTPSSPAHPGSATRARTRLAGSLIRGTLIVLKPADLRFAVAHCDGKLELGKPARRRRNFSSSPKVANLEMEILNRSYTPAPFRSQ